MVTGIGKSPRYFSGIAINNKTRKEMPSVKAIFLNQLNVFVDFIVYAVGPLLFNDSLLKNKFQY